MRFSYLIFVVIYVVVDLGCVFACLKDIFNNLGKEQRTACAVGETYQNNCIGCDCVKKNTVICQKVCDKISPKETTFCFRPKLEKRVSQKLSFTAFVENSYKELADLAKGCTKGDRITWKKCKCCNCVCISPGIAQCKPLIGCHDLERPGKEKKTE